jgi:hypothetical protein
LNRTSGSTSSSCWAPRHLNPLEAMLCYKQLWTVEQTFRTAKHLLATRPSFHKLDETIRGHLFCSLLALVLKKAGGPHRRARSCRLLARDHCRSLLADRDRNQPKRATLLSKKLPTRRRGRSCCAPFLRRRGTPFKRIASGAITTLSPPPRTKRRFRPAPGQPW